MRPTRIELATFGLAFPAPRARRSRSGHALRGPLRLFGLPGSPDARTPVWSTPSGSTESCLDRGNAPLGGSHPAAQRPAAAAAGGPNQVPARRPPIESELGGGRAVSRPTHSNAGGAPGRREISSAFRDSRGHREHGTQHDDADQAGHRPAPQLRLPQRTGGRSWPLP
jgi:hypothetical protein